MLQGVWIFLAFVVFNPSAREELKSKVRGGERRQSVPLFTRGCTPFDLVDDVDNKRD